ncbi:MAG: amidohydrolase [Anaerolineales bacterium]|nr:amidohydrolase [Anaerolineales bacterium]
MDINFLADALNLFDYTRTLRRDFHQHPELGFKEFRTAGIVARELNDLGLEVTTGIAKTGVVALLEGSRPGPVVLLRFDMDALPIVEETGAEYASLTQGVMHACGHDGHTAVGLTVARLLTAYSQEFAGTVKFVFQPAEEGLGGAEIMVAEGVLDNPKPDITLALHLWNEEQVGWLGIAPGPLMAAGEIFRVRVTGKGGHGALPNQTIDPVITTAQIISALQSIPSRNVSPLQSATISVGSIHGGEVFNVIPSEVEFHGTIRTFESSVRQVVLERFQQVVAGIAQSMGCEVEIDMQMLTPAVINDQKITAQVQRVAQSVLPDSYIEENYRAMVSEDMAFMMQDIPSCYFLIGSANPEKGIDASHHQPRFDIDEDVLPHAVALMAAATVSYLKS